MLIRNPQDFEERKNAMDKKKRTGKSVRRLLAFLLTAFIMLTALQISTGVADAAESLTLQSSFMNIRQKDKAYLKKIISTETKNCKNNLEKVKAIHDWMVKNIRYDTSYRQHNASDTLNNKIAVCSGYSTLFWNFMKEMGIPCEIVLGYSRGESHAWNEVKLGGKWYYIDVTWDDPLVYGTSNYPDGSNLSYSYFLVGSKTLNKDHSASRLPYKVSAADYDLKGLFYRNGWNKVDGVWRYYTDPQTYMTNTWLILDGSSMYYFDQAGAMATGWRQIGWDWYFFNMSGTMQKGWKQLRGNWYCFDDQGRMLTSWWRIDGQVYFFEEDGKMATGWKEDGGNWYYLGSNGKMTTGWRKIMGKWYYFRKSSGVMVTGSVKIDGTTYHFDKKGACKDK